MAERHSSIRFPRRSSTAPCGDVAPPVIDNMWECLLRRPAKEDKGGCQARVRLSKVIWGKLIATRYRLRRFSSLSASLSLSISCVYLGLIDPIAKILGGDS